MGSCISKTPSEIRHSPPSLNLYCPLNPRFPHQSNHFPRLPNELLLEITESLDSVRDRYALRSVNKHLAGLLDYLVSDILLHAYRAPASRDRLFSVPTRYPHSLVVHLVRLGVDLNTVGCNCGPSGDCECCPPLHYAIAHSNDTMVRSLLRLGARINVPCNDSGDNAVHLAIYITERNSVFYEIPQAADLAILRMLLGRGGLQTMHDPTSLNSIGLSWLNMAIRTSPLTRRTILMLFLVAGVSVDGADTEEKLTALHVAVLENMEDIVPVLLQMGADYRTVDSSGRSPFSTACYRPNCTLIDMLLRRDATLIDEAVNEGGDTAEICLRRKVEWLVARDETEYYRSEIVECERMLVKLVKLAEVRRSSFLPVHTLQMYYNSL